MSRDLALRQQEIALVEGDTSSSELDGRAIDSEHSEVRLGLIVASLFFIVFLGWAAFAPLDSAAFANGQLVVSGQRQSVQHRDGGVVAVSRMPAADEPVEVRGVVTRGRGKLYILAAATIAAGYLCFRLILPFIPAIVWATTAAVITHRFSQWVSGRVKSPGAKGAICTTTVAVAILLPIFAVGYVGLQQVANAMAEISGSELDKKIQEILAPVPQLQQAWDAVQSGATLVQREGLRARREPACRRRRRGTQRCCRARGWIHRRSGRWGARQSRRSNRS